MYSALSRKTRESFARRGWVFAKMTISSRALTQKVIRDPNEDMIFCRIVWLRGEALQHFCSKSSSPLWPQPHRLSLLTRSSHRCAMVACEQHRARHIVYFSGKKKQSPSPLLATSLLQLLHFHSLQEEITRSGPNKGYYLFFFPNSLTIKAL